MTKLPIPRPPLSECRPVDMIFPNLRKLKEEGKCPLCHGEITGFRNELSAREYRISGMCQNCQDSMFGAPAG